MSVSAIEQNERKTSWRAQFYLNDGSILSAVQLLLAGSCGRGSIATFTAGAGLVVQAVGGSVYACDRSFDGRSTNQRHHRLGESAARFESKLREKTEMPTHRYDSVKTSASAGFTCGN